MGTLEEHRLSKRANTASIKLANQQINLTPTTMKWTVIIAGMLMMARAAPVAEPEAFNLPAIASPAITGSAIVDGLLLGKVAFLKAAVLSSLLFGASQGGQQESYAAPAEYAAPVDSYGAPEETYGAPAPQYAAAPAPTYESPDTYGAPQQPVVDTYGPPQAAPATYHQRY